MIYAPERLGGGAFVTWGQEGKRRLELRLPLPSTAQKLASVFGAVVRMAAHWSAKVTVDGYAVRPGQLNVMLAALIDANKGLVERMARDVAEDVSESITLCAVMRPPVMGSLLS
ncbi:MAG: hypothetical protein ACI4XW_12285 [Candidatus Spyradocola sp.]